MAIQLQKEIWHRAMLELIGPRDIIPTCIIIKWNVQLATKMKIWPIFPTTWGKNLRTYALNMRQYAFFKLSQNIMILSKVVLFLYAAVPFFILRVHLHRTVFTSPIWFCCREGYLLWCCAHSECFIRHFKYSTCNKIF